MNKINKLFKTLWKEYSQVNKDVNKIKTYFESLEGKEIFNDHIALRTLKSDKIGIDQLGDIFVKLGYEKKDNYIFKEKKLNAYYYSHPSGKYPKVFISELEFENLSKYAQDEANKLLSYFDDNIKDESFLYSKRTWDASYETYNKLYKESEYLAWFYTFGFIPNHFTVSINHLTKFQTLEDLNKSLEKEGYILNSSGGKIKGSEELKLEQSSTMADKIKIKFIEGEYEVPSCYFEFALRYKEESGQLYQGFVSSSADKIFESTNK